MEFAALIGALLTRFTSRVGLVSAVIKEAEIEEWGKVQRIDSETCGPPVLV